MVPFTIPAWLPLLLLPCTLLVLMKKVMESKKQHPPGPPGLPLIGNMHQLGALVHQSLWQMSKKYGPLIRLKLGSVPLVVVSSAETARQILKIHDIETCSRPELLATGSFSYNFLDIAFAPYGEYWKELRKISNNELFSNKRVQSFRFIREEEVASLVQTLSQSAASKSLVDIKELLFSLSTNVIWRVAFGESFEENKWESRVFQVKLKEAISLLGTFSASDLFPYVGWIIDRLTGLHGRLQKSVQEMDVFLQEIIEKHEGKKVGEGKEDIVDVLLKIEELQNEQGSVTLSRNHIKAILKDVFAAGIESTGITMVWALTELMRSPRVMKKIQAEIRDVMGNKGKVNEDDIEKLVYLNMVVKETWRLHPPAPLLIPREVMSPFKVNGYKIYPKTRLHVNVWAIGRDPKIWKDPEEFLPERFAGSSIDFKGQHFEFLPFGGGRRACPGINMGSTLVELTLANLLYRFDWKLPNGMSKEDINIDEAPGISIHKKIPLQVVPAAYI
ncbi:cytochrome P450 71B37-like [Carica papaya]|uniref:cytochrome P450 71B37-like n=1 Tax=Carica papaya TaxID=3649 RepID=UPI000B8CCE22|nr:cytochrome P450 71B37-like [Carica papaya]